MSYYFCRQLRLALAMGNGFMEKQLLLERYKFLTFITFNASGLFPYWTALQKNVKEGKT